MLARERDAGLEALCLVTAGCRSRAELIASEFSPESALRIGADGEVDDSHTGRRRPQPGGLRAVADPNAVARGVGDAGTVDPLRVRRIALGRHDGGRRVAQA